jgi:hypothetical protein
MEIYLQLHLLLGNFRGGLEDRRVQNNILFARRSNRTTRIEFGRCFKNRMVRWVSRNRKHKGCIQSIANREPRRFLGALGLWPSYSSSTGSSSKDCEWNCKYSIFLFIPVEIPTRLRFCPTGDNETGSESICCSLKGEAVSVSLIFVCAMDCLQLVISL